MTRTLTYIHTYLVVCTHHVRQRQKVRHLPREQNCSHHPSTRIQSSCHGCPTHHWRDRACTQGMFRRVCMQYVCMYVCMYVCNPSIRIQSACHSFMCMYLYRCVRVCMCTRTYICICIYAVIIVPMCIRMYVCYYIETVARSVLCSTLALEILILFFSKSKLTVNRTVDATRPVLNRTPDTHVLNPYTEIEQTTLWCLFYTHF